MTSGDGVRRQLAAVAVLCVFAALRWHAALLDPELATDETDYTRAFAAANAGSDPYAVERFLYPPPFALAGAAAERALGERAVVFALRAANLLGAIAVIWISLGWTRWSWRTRLVAGCVVIAGWAPIHQSVAYGNISLAALGLTFLGLALLDAQPLAAGSVLGLGLAVKPLAPAVVALLPAWRPAGVKTPARWVAGASALAVLGLLLLWGRGLLPRMLERTAARPPAARSLALGRLLQGLGLDVPPIVLLVLVVAAGAVVLRLRPRRLAEFAVVACTAALYASPLVWTHTLALSLPAQLIAFDRVGAAWRRAAAGSSERRRRALTLAVLAACALAIQGSEALAAIDSASALAQTACVAPIVLAPALFACVVLRKAPAEPEPSGLGATVGQ